ncbi:zinc finger C2HC domain-containing protein 1A isoform X4 [Monodelphis domestica]|uniref:zinc finger C2HC domain-containing protein 1A isoform X4 n=1 Tax=Monodelphis domestica TaxID=13616 RepID=UPI0024E21E72|nr:zinc finger C2HC domain-containing protein 1A isoform X4 [Monodelphis domestica]
MKRGLGLGAGTWSSSSPHLLSSSPALLQSRSPSPSSSEEVPEPMGAWDVSGWEAAAALLQQEPGAAAAAAGQESWSGRSRSPRAGAGGAMEGQGENGSVVQIGELLPCKICGRTFFPVALKKHGPICQKTATKKRKAFDSSRQRAEGTDIPTVKPLKPRPEPPKKQSNWRRKHEEFIATIRAAKGLDQALKEGGKLPPPPPPSYDPDYIQCPYCQRRFNENAADRHINFCKEQAARISNKGKFSTDTKGKSTSRAQYKPPAFKKTNSPGTVPSASSRLPQPSNISKSVVAVPSSKGSSVSGSFGSKLQNLSPSHKGVAAPHSGGSTKARASTPPSLARNSIPSVLPNKRKTYNADSYTNRSDVDYSSVNGGSFKGNEGNSSGQLSKFCHECGTRYPVEWAKFCCECGIRRMVL